MTMAIFNLDKILEKIKKKKNKLLLLASTLMILNIFAKTKSLTSEMKILKILLVRYSVLNIHSK